MTNPALEALIKEQKRLLGLALLEEQKAENAFDASDRPVNRHVIAARVKAAWKGYDDAYNRVADALEALAQPPQQGAAENTIGAAESAVGRYVYRRIEVLMDAAVGTPEADELRYLATIAETVEEYGEEACANHAIAAAPPPPQGGVEPSWRTAYDHQAWCDEAFRRYREHHEPGDDLDTMKFAVAFEMGQPSKPEVTVEEIARIIDPYALGPPEHDIAEAHQQSLERDRALEKARAISKHMENKQ